MKGRCSTQSKKKQEMGITWCNMSAFCCCSRAWSCWGVRICCCGVCCSCCGASAGGVIMGNDTGTFRRHNRLVSLKLYQKTGKRCESQVGDRKKNNNKRLLCLHWGGWKTHIQLRLSWLYICTFVWEKHQMGVSLRQEPGRIKINMQSGASLYPT